MVEILSRHLVFCWPLSFTWLQQTERGSPIFTWTFWSCGRTIVIEISLLAGVPCYSALYGIHSWARCREASQRELFSSLPFAYEVIWGT